MRNSESKLLICENFRPEIESLKKTGDFAGVNFAFFPSRCGRPPLRDEDISKIADGDSGGPPHLAIGSSCLAAFSETDKRMFNCSISKMPQCLHLLTEPDLIDQQIRERGYLITPGWLHNWRDRLADHGDDEDIVKQIFAESITKLVFLQTVQSDQDRQLIDELSSHLDLPYEIIPCGLSPFKSNLSAKIFEHRLAYAEKARARAEEETQRQAADQMAVFDFLARVNEFTSEEEIIDKIFEFFDILFSPKKIRYLSLSGGTPQAFKTSAGDDAERDEQFLKNMDPDFEYKKRDDGFIFTIRQSTETIGIFDIDRIAFPEFTGRYLNFCLGLCHVIHLAITNARRYDEINRSKLAIAASENKFRTIVENINDAFIACDFSGKIIDANDKSVALLGYSRPQLIGENIREFQRLTFKSSFDDLLAGLQKDRSLLFDSIYTNREARIYLLEVSAAIVSTEGDGVIHAFLRDVTQRKKAELDLIESRMRLDLAMKAASMGAWHWNIEEKTWFLDELALSLHGLDPEKYDGSPELSQAVVYPDDQHEIETALARTISSDAALQVEYRTVHPDGSIHYLFAQGKLVEASAQTSAQLIGVVMDITERKTYDIEREELKEQLLQTQKMEAIGTLAGGVAHDFNNLLTGILGYASLLKTKFTEQSMEKQAIDTIERAAERAAELTAQLLGFARRGKNRIVQINIAEIINETFSLLSTTLEKNIRLTKNLSAPNSRVVGDPGQIQQVIFNLAINARDSIKEKGEITIETSETFLDREFCRYNPDVVPGSYLMITISDTGEGITDEIKSRVYEPFFTTKADGKGTGLGLSMVYGIVKNHGGHIQFESEPGVGTTFNVFLPSDHASTDQIGDGNLRAPTSGCGRILVVDDEDVVREVVSRMLVEMGYEVVLAAGGEEAGRIYAEDAEDIDLVIIDMIMPGIDGSQCFMNLKKINPKIKAIITTGFEPDGKVMEILDGGQASFLQKPYRTDRLAEIVSKTLKQKP